MKLSLVEAVLLQALDRPEPCHVSSACTCCAWSVPGSRVSLLQALDRPEPPPFPLSGALLPAWVVCYPRSTEHTNAVHGQLQ